VFSLGSWRTFERLSREQGLEIMRAARDVGITFLDDARYDDETGTAPIPTGYSEVIFGELFRAAGWRRDEVVVANKLWWEFWPDQGAAAELDGSLDRMGLDHVDLIYSMEPPPGLAVADLVAEVAGLISSGRARAWGIGNWRPAPLVEAVAAARELGVALPVAAQLPYSLLHPGWVADPAMDAVLADADIARMLEESHAHAAEDMVARSLAESRVDAERTIAATESALAADSELLSADERKAIDRALADVRLHLHGDDRHALHAATDALNRATEEFAARRMNRSVAQALTGRKVDALG